MLWVSTARTEPMTGWGARSLIRDAYLEIHHPVRHKGHHHRQNLHQHLEVGHVFLWRRSRLVRPLGRQQVGIFRVPVRPQGEKKDSHNLTLSRTTVMVSTSTTLLPGSPWEGDSEVAQLVKVLAFNLSLIPWVHTVDKEPIPCSRVSQHSSPPVHC